MKRVIAQFVTVQTNEEGDTVREIKILSNKEVHYRLNAVEGNTYHFTKSIADFEYEFKINLSEYLTAEDVSKFD